MIYDNQGSEISDVVPWLSAISGCDSRHTDLKLKKCTFSKKFLKIPPVALLQKLSKKQKGFVRTIMYNGKLNKNYLSTRTCLYEILKPKFSIPLPPDPGSLV